MRLPSLRRRRPLPSPVPSAWEQFEAAAAGWIPYVEDWPAYRWVRTDWESALRGDDDWQRIRAVHRLKCHEFRTDVHYLRDLGYIESINFQHDRLHRDTGVDPPAPGTLAG